MRKKRIVGVISDTHGLVDPKISTLFEGVDHILHAGDLGNLQVYHELQKLAPVTAISGNIDEGNLPSGFEPQTTVDLYGVRIFMIHILGNPHRLTAEMQNQIGTIQPSVLVFGHSHQPFLQTIGSILFFNPGSAGPKRFSLPRCLGLLEIEKGQTQGKIIEL
jgi:putative phosphoesterase